MDGNGSEERKVMVICFLKRKQANEFRYIRVDYYKIQKTRPAEHPEIRETDRIKFFSFSFFHFIFFAFCFFRGGMSDASITKGAFGYMFEMLIIVAVCSSHHCSDSSLCLDNNDRWILGRLCAMVLLQYGVIVDGGMIVNDSTPYILAGDSYVHRNILRKYSNESISRVSRKCKC